MRKLLVISTVIVLTLTLAAHSNAQNQVRSVSAGGTPLLPDNLVNRPVPRLPDGKPDLTGPWVGGGSLASVFASASIAVKNCAAIIFTAPWSIRCPTPAIVPPTCTSPL